MLSSSLEIKNITHKTCLLFIVSIAETESHEGKRKVEALWPIFK